MSSGLHIAVVGPIGAGKSTLVGALAEQLEAVPLLERFEESPYLSRFYEAPERWAFQHTLFFAEQSVRDQREAQEHAWFAVQERILREHLWVFGAEFHARAYLTDEDWELLVRLESDLGSTLKPTDLLVYIDVSSEEALRRLQVRQRSGESGVTLAYMNALAARYDAFIREWTQSSILRVDATQYDFRNQKDIALLAEQVRATVGGSQDATDSSSWTTRRWQEHTRT